MALKRIGVLLAAGQSKRMGRPKQLLPWPPKGENPKPLVAAAFDAIARVCDEMVVVMDHETEAVIAALSGRLFYREVLGRGEEPMFTSIRFGLMMARRLDSSACIMLQPADHPQVRLDTLQLLSRTFGEQPNQAVMPTYRGRGGHPAIIPACLVAEIIAYNGVGGLRQFWQRHAAQCVRVPTDDPGVVFDIDTQSDYDFCV